MALEIRFLTEMDVNRNHRVCVLGDDVAKNLFKDESPVGKRIKVGPDKYRVIGVNEKQGKLLARVWIIMSSFPMERFEVFLAVIVVCVLP